MTPEEIEERFRRANADPNFRWGVHKSGRTLTLEAKQFIGEMYERIKERQEQKEQAEKQ